jgi:hypothetical protein
LWWWLLWLLLGLAMGLQALRMRIAQAAVDDLAGPRAVAIRPQNGWGQALLAESQLSAGSVDAAIASSRRALDRTPLTVVAVRTLARSLDANAPAAGERAWQIASTMGWRDAQTQLWALLRALSNGQTEIFVIRADALMRTQPDDPRMMSVVRQALLEPRTRAAFLRRIAVDPRWRSELFVAGHPLTGRELQGTILALRGLGATKAPPTRAELHDSLAGLIAEGRFEEAVALDRQFVSRTADAGSIIDDGGFDRITNDPGDSTPFDWTPIKSASLEQSGGQRSMLLTRTTHRQPLVRRLVPLSAGRYRLAYSVKGDADSPASIGVTVRCIGSRTDLGASSREPLSSPQWHRRSFLFMIPDDCPLTILELTGFRGSDESEAQFDDIKIAPVS